MDVLEHTNSWVPNAADSTPPGSETMRVYRTNVGLLTHTATIKGKPYGYTKLRASYKREVDAAGAFADWNSPDVVHNARSWMRSGYKNDLTFNWFYVDDEHVAYFNSGANPVRAPRTHPNFPVKAKPKFLWRDYNPALNTFRRAPLAQHPQVIDQRFLTSWNNRQAHGYRCDSIRCYTSVYRVDSLDDNIRAKIRGAGRMSLVELIDAMETAGTVDLRGTQVVPVALKVIGNGGGPAVRAAVATLRAWVNSGAHRLDHDDDGDYDHAEAVRIMDAWWPLWVEGQFEPFLGEALHSIFLGHGHDIHDAPRAQSAPRSRARSTASPTRICGRRSGARSAAPTRASTAARASSGPAAGCFARPSPRPRPRAPRTSTAPRAARSTTAPPRARRCAATPSNAVDITAATVDEFHWINRPTFQQAISFPGGR